MDCGVCVASSSDGLWGRGNDSEHDLAMMVSDFLENGNSCSSGAESRYSSDSDSGLSDLASLAHKVSYLKIMMDQYESDLFSVVNSLALSISERDLQFANLGLCNASCIRFMLVQHLRLSGYDAGVCISRWQGSGKVPGGDHEYIDVIRYHDRASTDRLIVDIDFRSHFEIARAVDSYDRILDSLPIIYVGTSTKLTQFLHVMVEAARSSLKQNSMPLPPWRSFAYLHAKWQSRYIRKLVPDEEDYSGGIVTVEHKKCAGHLKILQASLKSDIQVGRVLKPLSGGRRKKLERQIHQSLRT